MDKTSVIAKVSFLTVPYILVVALQILTILSFYYNYHFYTKLHKQQATTKEARELSKIYYALFIISMIIMAIVIVSIIIILFKIRRLFE